MQDIHFFKKKQLLARRDQLLEEIGQSMFERGDLPDEFKKLPREFRGMDLLLAKLQERSRLFREERDHTVLDLAELTEQMAYLEKCYKRRHEPPRKEYDALKLKLKLKSQSQSVDKDELKRLEEKTRILHEELLEMERTHKMAFRELEEKARPKEVHIQKVEDAMLVVQREREGLSFSRAKRLSDLGYWMLEHLPDSPEHTQNFAKLKQYRRELSGFNQGKKTVTLSELSRDLPSQKESEHWRIPLFLLLAAIVLGYIFRTDFREEELNLPGLAMHFLPNQTGHRLYADLNQVKSTALQELMPDLSTLPGGRVTFSNMKNEDMLNLLQARDESGELLYFGVRFRRPPPRFAFRLNKLGWRYQPSVLNWKSLSDGEWVWLVLSERSFFLFRKEHLDAFVTAAERVDPRILILDEPVAPSSNNRPLLQGFQRVRLSLFNDGRNGTFRLVFRANEALVDLPQRRALLSRLNKDPSIQLGISKHELTLSGPRSFIGDTPLTPEILKNNVLSWITQNMHEIPSSTIPQPHWERPWLGEPGMLTVFTGHRHQPKERGSILLPEAVLDMTFDAEHNGLLVLHPSGLRRYELPDLNMTCALDFEQGFQPIRLLPTPNGRHSVLLERGSGARIMLIKNESLTIEVQESLLPSAREWRGAAWNASGDSLYLGVRKNGWGRVMVFRREEQLLSLVKQINLDTRHALSTLALHPNQNSLFMVTNPFERLLHKDLRDDSGRVLSLELNPNASPDGRPQTATQGLILNRTADALLILAASNGAVKNEPIHDVLHLVASAPDHLKPLDRLDPDFSIRGIWRRPLSDKLWLLGDGLALTVTLENQRLSADKWLPLPGMVPHTICSDPLGLQIFVGGRAQ